MPKGEKLTGNEAWETALGLPDDIDAWIANPRFGVKDEYAQQAGVDAIMFLIDMVNAEGELIGSQGWSVGAGWVPTADGGEIDHAVRLKIIKNSLYGKLMTRVKVGLEVPFPDDSSPLEAKWWDGLGFHWMQEPHDTLKEGETKMGLMPTAVLEPKKAGAVKGRAAATKVVAPDAQLKQLAMLAQTQTKEGFQKAAMSVKGVTDNDELMASILDDSDAGFWATHQE